MAEAQAGPNPPKRRTPAKVLDSKTFRDGAIYLYRRSDSKKPTGFCRVKIPGAKGYVWKSTKPIDEHAAYRTLKWRDLRPLQSAEDPTVVNLALTVKGKTGMREVVAGKADVKGYFSRILELRKLDLLNPKSDIYEMKDVPPDSYVFCGINGKPIESFKKSFATLLSEAKVLTDSYPCQFRARQAVPRESRRRLRHNPNS